MSNAEFNVKKMVKIMYSKDCLSWSEKKIKISITMEKLKIDMLGDTNSNLVCLPTELEEVLQSVQVKELALMLNKKSRIHEFIETLYAKSCVQSYTLWSRWKSYTIMTVRELFPPEKIIHQYEKEGA